MSESANKGRPGIPAKEPVADARAGNGVMSPAWQAFMQEMSDRLEASTVAVGDVKQTLQSDPGPGWLLAGRQDVSRADNPELFALIGVEFGQGDGSTTFALPAINTGTGSWWIRSK